MGVTIDLHIVFISWRTFECSYGRDWMGKGMRSNGLWPVRSHDLLN
jgi:hypothetical protein